MRWVCHHLFGSYDRSLSNIANIRLHSVSGHTSSRKASALSFSFFFFSDSLFRKATRSQRLAGSAERERRHVRKNFAGSNTKIVDHAELFAVDVQDRQFEHLTQIIQWCSPSLFLRTRPRVRRPGASGYVYACAGGTPLGAHTPCTRRKHLHGVIDCMVEVWISPVTFLLALINRSNYSISIALRHRIYALHIAGIPNADVSVT